MLAQIVMSSSRLTELNFILYASKHYDNCECLDVDEFRDDIKRLKYIKRLLNRYETTGELKERLILNHIIQFYNVFSIESASKMLFFKLDENLWPALKTFLVYLNLLPERINDVRVNPIMTSDIKLDPNIINVLRGIANERK